MLSTIWVEPVDKHRKALSPLTCLMKGFPSWSVIDLANRPPFGSHIGPPVLSGLVVHCSVWSSKPLHACSCARYPESSATTYFWIGTCRLLWGWELDWLRYSEQKNWFTEGLIWLVSQIMAQGTNLHHKREYTLHLMNIPGPKEPSIEQVNHVLRPIVNQLLKLWRTGI